MIIMKNRAFGLSQGFLGVMALVVTVFFSACSKPTDSEYVAKAVEFENSRDYRAAIIEYKNALNLNGDNLQARYALGRIYARIGDVDSARKELGIAYSRGYRADEARAALVKALVGSGKYKIVVDDFATEDVADKSISAEFFSYVGLAYLGLEDVLQAKVWIDKALEADSGSVDAIYGKAFLLYSDKQYETALLELNKALQLEPDFPEALLLRGDIELSQSEFSKAEASYSMVAKNESASMLTSYALKANLGLIQALISQKKFTQAKEKIAYLEKVVPDNPMVWYLGGLVAYEGNAYEEAENRLLKVINIIPNHQHSLLLLGAINYQQGELEQAGEYLTAYLVRSPSNVMARKLLAAARMKLRQPNLALDALDPVMQEAGRDVGILVMAGSAAVRSGDVDAGTAYLEKAISMSPDSAPVRTELALAYLAESNFKKAIEELETISSNSTGEVNKKAELMLVLTHLSNGDSQLALDVALEFLDKYPGDPVAYNILGIVYSKSGAFPEGRRAFQKAIDLDPQYTPAKINLAKMAYRDDDVRKAQSLYESILSYDADNVSVMMALSRIGQRLGEIEQAIHWAKEAVNASSSALEPRLLLVSYYLSANKLSDAKNILKEAKAISSDDVSVLLAQGLVDMAEGRGSEALAAFNAVLNKSPSALMALYQSGVIYSRTTNYDLAVERLNKVLELEPYHLPSIGLLVKLEIKRGNLSRAEGLIEVVKSKYPKANILPVLEGDFHFSQRRYKTAIAFYEDAVKNDPKEGLALKIAKSYRLIGEREKAYQVLVNWLDKRPDSYRVRLTLAGEQELRGDTSSAVENYEYLLSVRPNDPMVLNNLAWLYSSLGDPKAKDTAEKAYSVNSQDPYILDTLGWILVKNNELERAIRMLRKAVKLAPDVADIRYHLAVALKKVGEPDEARALLEELLDSPIGLSVDVADVRRMIDSL